MIQMIWFNSNLQNCLEIHKNLTIKTGFHNWYVFIPTFQKLKYSNQMEKHTAEKNMA